MMGNGPEKRAAILVAAAEEAVSRLEALALGEPWASALGEAEGAVGALRDQARAALFPDAPQAVSGDTIATYEFETRGFDRAALGQQLADLHGRALESCPELARLLRGRRVREDVAAAGAARASVLARPGPELAAEALAAYEGAIASQLHGRAEVEPWSGILAEVLPALTGRIAAARQRHEEHAAAELDRASREAEAAERAVEAERQRRRQALAERLRRLPQSATVTVPAPIGGVGTVLARHLARDVELGGYGEHLEELERQVGLLEQGLGAG